MKRPQPPTTNKTEVSITAKMSKMNLTGYQTSYFKVRAIQLLLTAILLVIITSASAQNQEVTIIAPYRPTISAAQKLTLNPVLTDTVVRTPQVNYTIASRPVFTSYMTESLKPTLIDVETGEVLRRNYLKAGFGNYTTPFFELYTNNLQSKKYALGFYARHHSSQGQIEDFAKNAFSNNAAGLNFRRYFNEKILSGEFYYNRDVVHYYGFKPADFTNDTISDDDLRQRFSLFGFNTTFASNHRTDVKPNYKAGLRFYHLSDLYETGELNIGLSSNLNTQNDFLAFAESQELGADLEFDYYQNTDSLQSSNAIALTLKPYLQLNFGYLDLTFGAGLSLASDSTSKFYIYPNIRAAYEVIPGYLRLYLSATGGLNRNSYRNVVSQNPWVNPLFPLGFSATKYDLKGGITGNINMFIDYNFNVSYSETDNMLFFVNDFNSPFNPEMPFNLRNKFTGIYDTATVTAVNLEVGYQQSRKFNLLARAIYRSYKVKNQEQPWHKPAIEIALTGKYLLSEQITVGSDIFYVGKTFAPVFETGIITTAENKGFIDLNLNAEYRFNDKVSAFAQVNNALSTRYYRFYNYPSQRINAMGGFIFSF